MGNGNDEVLGYVMKLPDVNEGPDKKDASKRNRFYYLARILLVLLVVHVILIFFVVTLGPQLVMEKEDVGKHADFAFNLEWRYVFITFGKQDLERNPFVNYTLVRLDDGTVVANGTFYVKVHTAETSASGIKVAIERQGRYALTMDAADDGPEGDYSVIVTEQRISFEVTFWIIAIMFIYSVTSIFILVGLMSFKSKGQKDMDVIHLALRNPLNFLFCIMVILILVISTVFLVS